MPEFALSSMELDEISLCPSGDNKGAKVVLAKADPDLISKPGRDRRGRSSRPNPKSTPKEIVGHHGHRSHGTSILWPALYEHLRLKGHSKASAARISNSAWNKKRKGMKTNTPTSVRGLVKSDSLVFIAEDTDGAEVMELVLVDEIGQLVDDFDAFYFPKDHEDGDFDSSEVDKADAEDDDDDGGDDGGEEEEEEDEGIDKSRNPGTGPSTVSRQEHTQGDKDVSEPKKITKKDDPPISKDDLDPAVAEYVEALEDEVDDLTAERDDALAKAEAAEKAAESDDDTGDGEPDLAEVEKAELAKASPALRALIEKAQHEAEEAGKVAKAERDARLEREFIAKAEKLPMLADGTEGRAKFAGVLRKAADTMPEPDYAELERVLAAANAQITEGNLFKSAGVGGGDVTISSRLEARAAEIQKADPKLTKDQAVAQAMSLDPSLYDEMVKEG